MLSGADASAGALELILELDDVTAAGADTGSSDDGGFESDADFRMIFGILAGSTFDQTPSETFIVAAAMDCWEGVLPCSFVK